MSKREFTPEEIAKSLRVCIDNAENGCTGCVTHHLGGNKACDALSEAAADMIEAQAKRIGELEGQLIPKNDELLKLREEREALEKQCHEAVQLLGRANNLLAQRTQELQSVSALAKEQDDCIVKCREEILRLREENRWIPTSERLPATDDGPYSAYEEEFAVQVLAVIEGAEWATELYFDGYDFFDIQGGEAIPYRVSHWKPMPKGSEVGHE